MCEDNHNIRKDNTFEDAEYAARRRENLNRFLREINSGNKPSDESMDWWLEQY
jgi:hypothetical protein